MRITRTHVLYHGTLLYDADLELFGKCLDFAPRQPEYRQDRSHLEFLTNVPLDPAVWAADLAGQFPGSQIGVSDRAFELAEELALNRYGQADWRFRH